ncbi:MAG: tetratricopeptide repeat protein [Fibrobacter sp.]|nr:tetratricopeptide repeat protein [Fibrobacter sp.]
MRFLSIIFSILLVACASKQPKGVDQEHLEKMQKRFLEEITNTLAHDYFLKGQDFSNLGQLDSAEFYFTMAHKVAPKSRFLAFNLAMISLVNGNKENARSWVHSGLDFEGELNLDEARIAAEIYFKSNMPDTAKIWYETIVEKWPTDYEGLFLYTVLLEEEQDYENLSRIYGLLLPQLNYPKHFVEKQILLLKLQGDVSKLIAFLTDVYKVNKDPEIGRELVSFLLKEQKYEEALTVSQSIIEVDSASIDTWKLMVRLAQYSKRYTEAIEWQKRIVEQHPDQVQELKRLALLEFQEHQLDSAQKNFSIYIDKVPNDHLVYFYLSNIFNIQGNRKKAIEHAQKAIALQPNSLAYRNQLAAIYYLNGEYSQAHQAIDLGMQLNPQNALAMRFKAMAYIHQAISLEDKWPHDDSDEHKLSVSVRLKAMKWQKNALEIDSLSTDLMFDLAANYERLDSLKASLDLFEKLLKIEPQNHRALNYLGYLLVDNELNIPRGALLIDSALVLEPENLAYLDSKAWAYAKQKEYEKAREILENLVQKATSDFVTYWEHLAYVYHKMGLKDRAIPLWENVLKINPHSSVAQKYLQVLADE